MRLEVSQTLQIIGSSLLWEVSLHASCLLVLNYFLLLAAVRESILR